MEDLRVDSAAGVIREGASGTPWAEFARFAVSDLTDVAAVETVWPDLVRSRRLVVAPGSGGSVAQAGEDPIERSFRRWSEEGRAGLEVGLRLLSDAALARGVDILIRPALGTLISDIPGLLSVCRRQDAIGVFLEPAALTPAQEQFRTEDFVTRFLEILPLPAIRAICLASGPEGFGVFEPLARSANHAGKPIVRLN
ncbi:MAG: hypothetical protein JNM86_01000 [Phycisphaerae bacterium]|nr:hypothetical protein [Phycisphaerae bacterium]